MPKSIVSPTGADARVDYLSLIPRKYTPLHEVGKVLAQRGLITLHTPYRGSKPRTAVAA